jgi:hypothetical protein
MKKLAITAGLLALLGGIVWAGTTIKPFRASGGVQMVPTGGWNGQPDMGGIFYKADAGVMAHNPDNTNTLLGAGGGGVTWPLANGSSTDTFNYAGTFGGTSVAYSSDTTNAPSGLGDDVWAWRTTGTKRWQMKYNPGTDNAQLVSPTTFVDVFDNASSGLRIHSGVDTELLSAGVTVLTATQASVIGSGSNSLGTSAALWPSMFGTWHSTGALTTLSSAGTITPTVETHKVSGTTAIATIAVTNLPTGYNGCIKLIPTGLWTTTTAGNISLATTAVVNKVLIECWDGTKWNPSY